MCNMGMEVGRGPFVAKFTCMPDAAFPLQEYLNELDPSVLRFLIAAREEVDSKQLRDDLLSMLVAGHETTGVY